MSRAVIAVNPADISQSALTRHAGPIAVVAGVFFAGMHVALWALADRSNLVQMLTDPLFRVVNAAYFVAFFGLLAVVAVHAWQARYAGTFGVVGFGAALLGILNLGGNMWFEGCPDRDCHRVARDVDDARVLHRKARGVGMNLRPRRREAQC